MTQQEAIEYVKEKAAGMSIAKIADSSGLAKSTVANFLRGDKEVSFNAVCKIIEGVGAVVRIGLPLKTLSEKEPIENEAFLEQIKQDYAEKGLSIRAIADKHGLTYSYVKYRIDLLKRSGLEKSKSADFAKIDNSQEEIKRLFELGYSRKNILKALGVAQIKINYTKLYSRTINLYKKK